MIQLVDYMGTRNNTQGIGIQSAKITNAEKTSMEQWPPLSTTKEGMKTPTPMLHLPMIDSAMIAIETQLKDVNPSSRKTNMHVSNLVAIAWGKLEA